MKILPVLFLALSLSPLPASPSPADKVASTPDLCQTDPAGAFAGDGSQFCAPVSVSNSLMYLAKNGFSSLDPGGHGDKAAQLRMVRTLSSAAYLDTDTGNGTNPAKVLNGVSAYLAHCGAPIASLTYEGWRAAPPAFSSGESHPRLSWLRSGIAQTAGAVWLNLGWYRPAGDQYIRHGGHWVTLVGLDGDALVIHNPSPKAGLAPSDDVVHAERLDRGTLANGKENIHGLPRPAKGYYQITGALPMPAGDIAILDSAIVLELRAP